MSRRLKVGLGVVAVPVVGAMLLGMVLKFDLVPAWVAAALIVRVIRIPVFAQPARAHESFEVRTEDGLTLRGWLFRPQGVPRGLVVYLHGKDRNRTRGAAVADRYVPRGLAVLAYDSRAHGESDGKYVTFGAREAPDLRRAIDQVGIMPVFLIGESLGAAVALLEAADDSRVAGVAAAAAYADLETRIRETAGHLDPDAGIALAETWAGFKVADAAPARSAARIKASVLLLHGTADAQTPLHHSQQIFDALTGPKKFIRFEGVGHNDVLRHEEVWSAIDQWLFPQLGR